MVGDILQPTHLLFVLVVALLVLGPKRLPEVARTLGNGLRDFRSAISGESHDDAPRTMLPEDTTPAPPVEPASVVHSPAPEAAPIHESVPTRVHDPAPTPIHESAPAPVHEPGPAPAQTAVPDAAVPEAAISEAAVPEAAPPEHPASASDAATSHSPATPSQASAGAASEHSG